MGEGAGGRGDQQLVALGDVGWRAAVRVGDEQPGDGARAPGVRLVRVGLTQAGALGAEAEQDALGALDLGAEHEVAQDEIEVPLKAARAPGGRVEADVLLGKGADLLRQ